MKQRAYYAARKSGARTEQLAEYAHAVPRSVLRDRNAMATQYMGRASVTTKRLRDDAENVANGGVVQSTVTTGVRNGFNRRLHSLMCTV